MYHIHALYRKSNGEVYKTQHDSYNKTDAERFINLVDDNTRIILVMYILNTDTHQIEFLQINKSEDCNNVTK